MKVIDEINKELTESTSIFKIVDVIPVKSATGIRWKSMPANKKHLSKDFNHRCCYCGDKDEFQERYRNYQVEHFAPKSIFPFLKYNYDNLLYCCPYCNRAKSNKWPSSTPALNVVNDQGFVNPCNEEYYTHVARKSNGKIIPLTALGRYMYNEIKLYLNIHEYSYNMEKFTMLSDRIEALLNGDEISELQRKELEDLDRKVLKKMKEYYSLYNDEQSQN